MTTPGLLPVLTLLATVLVVCAIVLLKRIFSRDHLSAQQTLDSLPDAVAIFDRHGKLRAVNRKLEKLLPLKIDRSVFAQTDTHDLYTQISPDSLAIERARGQALDVADDADSTLNFELPSYGRKSLSVKERPTDDGGTAVSIYGNGSATQHTKRLSDPLTGLPNRQRLANELANRCTHARSELSLIIVDIKSFRQINDTYGRESGDELLKQTAVCIQKNMPSTAFISRTAGDEFSVLLESEVGRVFIETCVSNLLQALRQGLKINDMNVPVRASVGIAYAPEHGNTVSSLLKAADSACAHAKHLSDNHLVVYNSFQQRQAKHRHQLEVGLQQAIEKDELALQYQPQIDTKSKLTVGMEALLRWNSSEFGKVSPSIFIPIAEKTGIIHSLGIWVLEQAVRDYQRLATFGMSPAILSINLSRKQFEDDQLVIAVKELLDTTGFDAAKLCFEITETALARDTDKLHKQLIDLTSLGARLSIDDFGVGYSSLKELRDFPISEVKIDREFVTNIATDQHSQDIVSAIVDISRSLGAVVVAEGVENKQQLDKIAELGCDRAQGYYISEPMTAATFPDLVLDT